MLSVSPPRERALSVEKRTIKLSEALADPYLC
jgi:hypothetical protein